MAEHHTQDVELRADQTRFFGDPRGGDCVRASIATLLGWPLSDVPDFPMTCSEEHWEAVDSFLGGLGLVRQLFPSNQSFEGSYLASGPSSRGCAHMVVMRDGKLLHDPHPSREGLLSVEYVHLVMPVSLAPLARRSIPQGDEPAKAAAQGERSRFEKWFASWSDPNIGSVEVGIQKRAATQAWLARATIAAVEAGEAAAQGDELPPLPEDKFCQWLQYGQVVNAFVHGVGDKSRWDRDQYWTKKGYDRAPLYTADQMREYGAACRAGRAKGEDARDADRLMFATQDFDGFAGVKADKYDFAIEVAHENGRVEPTAEDELNGVRRLIDRAIEAAATAPEGKGE